MTTPISHKAEVVSISTTKLPNSDHLSLATVFGYTVVCKTDDFKNVPLAVFIPPDSLVDTKRPEFSFLAKESNPDGFYRVKAKRLRGTQSFGFLIPAPPGSILGDDVTELLQIKHYQPPITEKTLKIEGVKIKIGGEIASAPPVPHVYYDLLPLKRFPDAIPKDSLTFLTEKMDGENSRYVYSSAKQQQYCGSHGEWKKQYYDRSHITLQYLLDAGCEQEKAKNIVDRIQSQPVHMNKWWELLENTPQLAKFCRDYPDHVVYGERIGNHGKLKYHNHTVFLAFDIMYDGKYLDPRKAFDLFDKYQIQTVPILDANFLYDFQQITSLTDGPTTYQAARPNCIREGVVVKPVTETVHPRYGRLALKSVSVDYFAK